MNHGTQLAQARPTDTNNALLYSPPAYTEGTIEFIIVANTTGSAATYRIFHDDDGTTYDQTTALFYDVSLAANSTVEIEVTMYLDDTTSRLAVRSSTGSALTFTVYGREEENQTQ